MIFTDNVSQVIIDVNPALSVTSVTAGTFTDSGLTNGQLVKAGSGGVLQSLALTSNTFPFSFGTTLTIGAFTSTAATIAITYSTPNVNFDIATTALIQATQVYVTTCGTVTTSQTPFTTGTAYQSGGYVTGASLGAGWNSTDFIGAIWQVTSGASSGSCAMVIGVDGANRLIVTPIQSTTSGNYRLLWGGTQSLGGITNNAGSFSNTGTVSLGGGFTYYGTGNISQSGTAVTGVGTTFVAGHIGCTIDTANGFAIWIENFLSTTSLTAYDSKTVASTEYTITCGGTQMYQGNFATTGQVTLGVPGYGYAGGITGGFNTFNVIGQQPSAGKKRSNDFTASPPLWEFYWGNNPGQTIAYPVAQIGAYDITLNQAIVQGGCYRDYNNNVRSSRSGGAGIVVGAGSFNGGIGGINMFVTDSPGVGNICAVTNILQVQSNDGVANNKVMLPQETASSALTLNAQGSMTGIALTNTQVISGTTPAATTLTTTAGQTTIVGAAGTITFGLANPTVMTDAAIGSTGAMASTFRTVGTSVAVDSSTANLIAGMAGGIFTCGAVVAPIAYVVNTTSMVLTSAIALSAGTSCTISYAGLQATPTFTSIGPQLRVGAASTLGVLGTTSTLNVLGGASCPSGVCTAIEIYPGLYSGIMQLAYGYDNEFIAFDAYYNTAWNYAATSVTPWYVLAAHRCPSFCCTLCFTHDGIAFLTKLPCLVGILTRTMAT